MRLLFFFLDGIGLGPADPDTNPFARADMPHLQGLLGGRRLLFEPDLLDPDPRSTSRASLLALDAALGVPGLPQSATGQATLLTGDNVPAALGFHYGPKPNPLVAERLRNGNLFSSLAKKGRRAALLNAYPPAYFAAIQSGRRLFSAIPLAVTSAGLPLKTDADLFAGQALSADLTGEGWRDRLGFSRMPLLSPRQAGERLAHLARQGDFSFFEFWLTDYVGHKQDMAAALALLATFDQALAGLVEAWDDQEGLILLTSDHGNLEDLSTRRHTYNRVPALLIGAPHLRQIFSADLADLTGVAPAILNLLG
jgi:2,3-bisphosphoglycerate-independent phosphoglycerate mutase